MHCKYLKNLTRKPPSFGFLLHILTIILWILDADRFALGYQIWSRILNTNG